MSSPAPSFVPSPPRQARLEVLFDELAELTGQRNAIDARIVDIVAEIDGDQLWGNTGCRSVAALVAWKTGTSPTNAQTIATVAGRLKEFPRCTDAMREGRLSLDQVGVIAARAGEGSDAHYAQLAASASVTQLRTAVKLEPRPKPSRPEPEPSITKHGDEHGVYWRIRLWASAVGAAARRPERCSSAPRPHRAPAWRAAGQPRRPSPTAATAAPRLGW
jgi:Domain of unknown function (DUF222)